jgi:hypothetical protein
MRKLAILGLGLSLLVILSWRRDAAQEKPQPPPASREAAERGERAFGTIAAVGVDRFDIKKADGAMQTVMVDAQTRYRQGEQEIQLEDLKPGDRVFVRGRTSANKEFVAVAVRRVTEAEAQRFQNPGERAFGEIISIDKNQIKIRNPRQGERTLVVNDQTEFMKQGQPITLKDLKVGDRIFAMGKEAQGQFLATRIITGRAPGQGQRQAAPER